MRSFTARLTLRFALLVTTTMAVILAAGGFLLQRQAFRALDLANQAEGRELTDLLGNKAEQTADEIRERVARDADSDTALFFIQIDDSNGKVIYRSANLGSSLLPPADGDADPRDIRMPALGDLRLSSFPSRGPWRISVASFLQPTRQVLHVYFEVSAALLGGAALVSLALGYAFSRVTLRPIRAIEATARRIGVGNFHERIPVPAGRDEIVSLTVLLNQTFDRLQESFDQVSRFTADASHELKTPLALVRLNAEKLRKHLARDPESTASLDDLLEEMARLQQVIDRLLFLARASGGALVPELRSIRTTEFVADFTADAVALAEDGAVRFVVGRSDPAETRAEPVLLRQLLLNLVSNAVSVTHPGGTVTLESTLSGNCWCLAVIDEGPGLPADQLKEIFGRFVRYPPVQGQARPGHGLGLAISKSIAELHGGTIRAENRFDRLGLRLVVELPVARV